MPLIDLANPTRFLRIVNRVLPWLAAATLIAFAVGIYQATLAPDDAPRGFAESYEKKDAKKVFTDIRSLTVEQRNELHDMMIKADFGEEDENRKNEDF